MSTANIARAKLNHGNMLPVSKKHRGKALAIHARAGIRLTEECEAAPERGELARDCERGKSCSCREQIFGG